MTYTKKNNLNKTGMALPMAIVLSVLFTTILMSLLSRGTLFQDLNALEIQKTQNEDLARLQLEYFIETNRANLCSLTTSTDVISTKCLMSSTSSLPTAVSAPFLAIPLTNLSIFYVDNESTRSLISCAEKSNVAATTSVKYQCPLVAPYNLSSFGFR
jgi:hypothetical protein